MSNIILNCLVLSGEYTATYKYWEWIKRTNTATRAIQNGNLFINLIHMHTKAPIHHHDHKPTHGLPHTWQIKHSHYQNEFTQNPQPIHKSTNPRPHWSWLHTKHLATTTTHHTWLKITTHRQNPIRNPNIGSHKIHDLYPHGFTQKSYPYHHGSRHSKLTIQNWVRERNREVKNWGEERREQPRRRETKTTRERATAEFGGSTSGAWFRWKNKDLGHGGLGLI